MLRSITIKQTLYGCYWEITWKRLHDMVNRFRLDKNDLAWSIRVTTKIYTVPNNASRKTQENQLNAENLVKISSSGYT